MKIYCVSRAMYDLKEASELVHNLKSFYPEPEDNS
jgi:hypothetical protein